MFQGEAPLKSRPRRDDPQDPKGRSASLRNLKEGRIPLIFPWGWATKKKNIPPFHDL
jgi:hypothetical protein